MELKETTSWLHERLGRYDEKGHTKSGRKLPNPKEFAARVARVDWQRFGLGGAADEAPDPEQVIQRARAGAALSPREQAVAEAMVIQESPPCRIRGGVVLLPPREILDRLPTNVLDVLLAMPPERLALAIAATARIDLVSSNGDRWPQGTGFVVGKNRLLTNRHVAEAFAWSSGGRPQISPNRRVEASFGFEVLPDEADAPPNPGAPTVRVVGVELLHGRWDAAILVLAGADERAPVLFDRTERVTSDAPAAALGYPSDKRTNDGVYDAAVADAFEDIFSVKRFAPGRTQPRSVERIETEAGNHYEGPVLRHDCTTLPGSSGSAIIDLTTGRVVGLHFLGLHFPGRRAGINFAMPISDLAEDRLLAPYLRANEGIVFPSAPPSALAPEPARRPPNPLPTQGPKAAPPTVLVTATPQSARADGPSNDTNDHRTQPPAVGPLTARWGRGWPERAPDRALASLLNDEALGPAALAEVEAMYGDDVDLRLEALEGDGAIAERADGPTVVLLHGFLGSHLGDVDTGDRYWFDPADLLTARVFSALALPESPHGPRVRPNGIIDLVYGRARRLWRRSGLRVVPFAYDWRRSLGDTVSELDAVLRGASRDRSLTVVGHSMGGVLAALWASRTPDWRDVVANAVTVGTPWLGTFAPIDSPDSIWFRTLRLLNPNADPAAVLASFPGMFELLPDPAWFDAEAAFVAVNYTGARPAQRVLDVALALKAEIRDSPLREVTTAFAGDAEETRGAWSADAPPVPGDGVVPYRSAVPPGVLGHRVVPGGAGHVFLLRHPGVIDAVEQIARGRPPTALPEGSGVLTVHARREAASEFGREGLDSALRARLEANTLTSRDLDLLLDPLAPVGWETADVPVAEAEFEGLAEASESESESLSGPEWVARFPGSRTTDSLVEPFRSNLERFLAALAAAGIAVTLTATRRPRERAHLMHYAWRIAERSIDPTEVPELAGVSITWVHPTPDASIAAARAMVAAYGLAFRPSLTSRHIEGRAADMRIRWRGERQVAYASGALAIVRSADGTDLNPTLHQVGASYGVFKLVSDRPHWSDDGR